MGLACREYVTWHLALEDGFGAITGEADEKELGLLRLRSLELGKGVIKQLRLSVIGILDVDRRPSHSSVGVLVQQRAAYEGRRAEPKDTQSDAHEP